MKGKQEGKPLITSTNTESSHTKANGRLNMDMINERSVKQVSLKVCPLCGQAVNWSNGKITCVCGLVFNGHGTKEMQELLWNSRAPKRQNVDDTGKDTEITTKEFARKYGVSYHTAYEATFGIQPLRSLRRGKNYSEKEMVANLKDTLKKRAEKQAGELAETKRLLTEIRWRAAQ